MLRGYKTFFASKTVWAALGVMLFGAFDLFGIANDPQLREDMRGWFTNIGQIVLSAIAMWARVVATTQIGTPSSGGTPTSN